MTEIETQITRAMTSIGGDIDADETVDLPADGRYVLGDGTLELDFRVDLEGSNIVSGDLFATAQDQREYMGSFRSEPGTEITTGTNPIPIIAEARGGRRAYGMVDIIEVRDEEITVRMYFDSSRRPPGKERLHAHRAKGFFRSPRTGTRGRNGGRHRSRPDLGSRRTDHHDRVVPRRRRL